MSEKTQDSKFKNNTTENKDVKSKDYHDENIILDQEKKLTSSKNNLNSTPTNKKYNPPIAEIDVDKIPYIPDKKFLGVQTKSNGWIKSGSDWYYYENGIMVTGWKYINSYWYYFQNDGKMKRGWLYYNGYYYYFFYEGQMATGWQILEGKFYYFYSDGKMATNWSKIDGEWYYMLESGGYQTGWLKLDNTYYYFYSSGVMATGWLQLNNSWYYLDSNGKMQTGWKELDYLWYYFYSNGTMATGWDRLENKTYYFYTKDDKGYKEGSMAKNTTIGDYVINKNGVLVTDLTKSQLLTLSGKNGILSSCNVVFNAFSESVTLPILINPAITVKASISLDVNILQPSENTGTITLTTDSINSLAYNLTTGLNSANIGFNFDSENISKSLLSIGNELSINKNISYKTEFSEKNLKITFEIKFTYKEIIIYQNIMIIINKDNFSNNKKIDLALEAVKNQPITAISSLTNLFQGLSTSPVVFISVGVSILCWKARAIITSIGVIKTTIISAFLIFKPV